MSSRYLWAGRSYDLVSLEPIIYRRPRARLMELLGPLPDCTVVDVGCGTGLNFDALSRLVGPSGTVVGVDPSPSMLAAARRRIGRAGWANVLVFEAEVKDLAAVVQSAGVDADAIAAVVATFVVSLLADESEFWAAVGEFTRHRVLRVALADLGPPGAAPRPLRPLLRALTALGGSDPNRRPWAQLIVRAPDTVHEVALGGHVHLAVGTLLD